MFFLVICGFAVEAAIGHLRFLLFYLFSGVVAGVSHAAMDLDSSSVLIGASGSVSAVMAMYLGVFRFKKIEFFYWFFIFVGYFRAPALLILPFYIGKELVQFYTEAGSNVAFMAHAGGFVAGLVLALPIWRALGGSGFWDRTDGHPPHPEATYRIGRTNVPNIRRKR